MRRSIRQIQRSRRIQYMNASKVIDNKDTDLGDKITSGKRPSNDERVGV